MGGKARDPEAAQVQQRSSARPPTARNHTSTQHTAAALQTAAHYKQKRTAKAAHRSKGRSPTRRRDSSRPRLLVALARADSSTLRTRPADFLGEMEHCGATGVCQVARRVAVSKQQPYQGSRGGRT